MSNMWRAIPNTFIMHATSIEPYSNSMERKEYPPAFELWSVGSVPHCYQNYEPLFQIECQLNPHKPLTRRAVEAPGQSLLIQLFITTLPSIP